MIVIDGPIGDPDESDAVFCRDVVAALSRCTARELLVCVTSWGGNGGEAEAIVDAVKQDGRRSITRIRRIAASAGAFIAMAGDRIEIEADAFLMLHGTVCFAPGDGLAIGVSAEVVDEMNATLARQMARLSGRSFDAELARLNAGDDLWFSADEALREGYVHAIVAPSRRGCQ